LTEGLGLIELISRCLRRTDSKEQRAATTTERIIRMLAYCEEIVKEKKMCLARKASMLDFLKFFISPPVLLDIGDDDPDNQPTVREEVCPS
jgi:hypothetical protein